MFNIQRFIVVKKPITRLVSSLTPLQITQILTANEISLTRGLPKAIKSITCNQLASNNPIEDRVKVSSILLPGSRDPSIIIGVFDGHGGGTTADLISQRLFHYIALSLHPEPASIKISDSRLKEFITDLYSSPRIDDAPLLNPDFMTCLSEFSREVDPHSDVTTLLKDSFKRCDHDLSMELQRNLQNPHTSKSVVHHCLSAAVSGCCAIVMVIHQGVGYIASSGDCRAVMGLIRGLNNRQYGDNISQIDRAYSSATIELSDEHNCDNISEIRRLGSSHPKSEQNTIIRHNRLLGQLMPFRAFGDFNYKWSIETIRSCGLTKAYGSNVIPLNYKTPPYLIVEPDVKEFAIENDTKGDGEDKRIRAANIDNCEHDDVDAEDRYDQRSIIIASDGLWEQFESSREVVDTIVTQMLQTDHQFSDIDKNSATHLLRSALRSSPYQESSIDSEELFKLHHARLESFLTLPQAVVRNFRDDISIVVVQFNGEA